MGRKRLWRLRGKLRDEDTSISPVVPPANEPVVTIERGSFIFGVCDGCGWEGSGRRSRSAALRDLAGHAKECSKGSMARRIP